MTKIDEQFFRALGPSLLSLLHVVAAGNRLRVGQDYVGPRWA